jgi:threonylcarbamoyladenosine tRNA methylthiotransferase CDKAL1
MTSPNVYIADNLCTVYKLVLHKVQTTLVGMGYGITASPEEADICLVGLCASFEADEDRSCAIVNRTLAAGKATYAYGCMVTVDPTRLAHVPPLPSFPSWDPGGLLRAVTGDESLFWTWRGLPNGFRGSGDYRVPDESRKFVGISIGCNFGCSYCPHKIGTGPLVSVPHAEVVDQARRLEQAGMRTIVLTGTDTACYGADIGTSFAWLLADLLGVLGDGIAFQVSQFNPQGLFRDRLYREDMLDLLSERRVVDIQLPIQTASPRLLGLMNRDYDPAALADFLTRLRARNPRAFLRTDLMVGFPTETMADLRTTVAYASEHFDEVAVYAFEMKDASPLSRMGLRPLPDDKVLRRRDYASLALAKRGLLVHSGGQAIETLLQNDKTKALLAETRREQDANQGTQESKRG